MSELERHVRRYMVAVTRGDHEAQIAAYEAMYDDLTPPAGVHPPAPRDGAPGAFCMACGARLVERPGDPARRDCPNAKETR